MLSAAKHALCIHCFCCLKVPLKLICHVLLTIITIMDELQYSGYFRHVNIFVTFITRSVTKVILWWYHSSIKGNLFLV